MTTAARALPAPPVRLPLPVASRVFAGRTCERCDEAFLVQLHWDWLDVLAHTPPRWCARCGQENRRSQHVCPVPGCTATCRRRPVCPEHWNLVESSCLQKLRHPTPAAAKYKQDTVGLSEYLCPVCKSWHNGGGVNENMQEVREAAHALAGALGTDELAALVREWAPTSAGRRKRWDTNARRARPIRQRLDRDLLTRIKGQLDH